MARRRGRPALGDRKLTPINLLFTPDQRAWLEARADAAGAVTVAAVVRQIVQAEIERERQQQEASA